MVKRHYWTLGAILNHWRCTKNDCKGLILSSTGRNAPYQISDPLHYGSQSEYIFHQQHPSLMAIHNRLLKDPKTKEPITFYDNQGMNFHAMGDFYHAETRTVIEFKCDKLNWSVNKADSDYKNANYVGRNAMLRIRDCNWSNSIYKHLIVQQGLAERGFNYLVVFSYDSCFSHQLLNRYLKHGLHAIFQWNIEYYLPYTINLTDWHQEPCQQQEPIEPN